MLGISGAAEMEGGAGIPGSEGGGGSAGIRCLGLGTRGGRGVTEVPPNISCWVGTSVGTDRPIPISSVEGTANWLGGGSCPVRIL